MRSEPIRRSGLAALGHMAAAALLAACVSAGEDEQPAAPLIIERAPDPPDVDQRLDLVSPLDRSGFFAFDSWPSACELLTDADIRAVLPQVDAVERHSDDLEIQLMDSGRTVTAANARCRMEFDIPDAGLSMESFDATVLVGVEAAGSPDVVDRNFHTHGDTPVEVPDGECYVEGDFGGVSCRKGSLAFEITSRFGHQHLGGDSWTDQYRVDGETTTFTGERGGGDTETFTEGQLFLRDNLDVELAKIVLAKIDR